MKIKNAKAILFTVVMIFILCFGHVGVMAEEEPWVTKDGRVIEDWITDEGYVTDETVALEIGERMGEWRREQIEERRFEGEWVFGGGTEGKKGLYAYRYDRKMDFFEVVDISDDSVDLMGKANNGSTPADAGDRVVYTTGYELISVKKDGTSRIVLEEIFKQYFSGEEVKAVGDIVYYINSLNEVWCEKADGTTRSIRVTPYRRSVANFYFIDGGYIYYQSRNYSNNTMEIYRAKADGTGDEQLLHSGAGITLKYAKDDGVYYTDNAVSCLMKMDSNGKNHITVIEYGEQNHVSTVYGVTDKWLFFNFNDKDLMVVTTDGSHGWGILLGDNEKEELGIEYITNVQVFYDTVYLAHAVCFQGDTSDRFYRILPTGEDWDSGWDVAPLAETLAELYGY
jgi:hypothetical protein